MWEVESPSIFTGLGFGQHARDIHVGQPEGSIQMIWCLDPPGRYTDLPFCGCHRDFYERRLFPPLRRQEVA